MMAEVNPVPPSEYIASQYYVPLSAALPLCIGWYLSRFKPWSKRSPNLVLSGLTLSVLIVFLQSLKQTCLYHTAWRLILQPLLIFSLILLPGYRYNINCRFRDAMQEKNVQAHFNLLKRLKWEASYSHLIILFTACITPQLLCMVVIAGFTDDFNSSEKDYRAYGDDGFCSPHLYETIVVLICGAVYALGWVIMLRKLKGRKDEFGISTALYKMCQYVLVNIVVYGIVVFVEKYYFFYYMRAFIIATVVYTVGINAYDVRVYAKEYREDDKNQDARIGLLDILQSSHGINSFRKQLVDEFAAENLAFWSAVNSLEEECLEEGGYFIGYCTKAKYIFDVYISESAPLQVNVSGKVRQKLKEEIKGDTYSPTMFSDAKEEIFKLMASDSLPRFRRSSHFPEFQRAHQLEDAVGVELSVAQSSRVLDLYLLANQRSMDDAAEDDDGVGTPWL